MGDGFVEYTSREKSASAAKITDPDANRASLEQMVRGLLELEGGGSSTGSTKNVDIVSQSKSPLSGTLYLLDQDLPSGSREEIFRSQNSLHIQEQNRPTYELPSLESAQTVPKRDFEFVSESVDVNSSISRSLDAEGADEMRISIYQTGSTDWDVHVVNFADEGHNTELTTVNVSTATSDDTQLDQLVDAASPYTEVVLDNNDSNNTGSYTGSFYLH